MALEVLPVCVRVCAPAHMQGGGYSPWAELAVHRRAPPPYSLLAQTASLLAPARARRVQSRLLP